MPRKESSAEADGSDRKASSLFLIVSVLFGKSRESVWEDRSEERL